MKNAFLFLAVAMGVTNAFASVDELTVGRYFNPDYNGDATWQRAWVDIRVSELGVEAGGYELVFNIPCGTKVTPEVYKIPKPDLFSNVLELVDLGSSQCYLGTAPKLFVYKDTIEIYTNPRIRTPGFSGSYKLKRVDSPEVPDGTNTNFI